MGFFFFFSRNRMFREIIFIVREQGFSKPQASSNEKFFLINLKKNLRRFSKNPFPTALNHFPRSQPISNYNRSKSHIYPMQKNQVILINHPTQPAFSPFPNQRYPKAAFPNSPTCLNLSRSPTHQTTNQKIPKYHNLLRFQTESNSLSLSPIPTYLNIQPNIFPFKKKPSSTPRDK